MSWLIRKMPMPSGLQLSDQAAWTCAVFSGPKAALARSMMRIFALKLDRPRDGDCLALAAGERHYRPA